MHNRLYRFYLSEFDAYESTMQPTDFFPLFPLYLNAMQLKERLSYYRDTEGERINHPRLKGHVSCDTLVVGAGFAGLNAALEMQESGYDTILIEAEDIGYGASGRNGGQAIFGWHHDFREIQKEFGKEVADTAWDLAMESLELMANSQKKYQIDCDYLSGYNTVSLKKRFLPEFEAILEDWNKRGYPHKTQMLSRGDVIEKLPQSTIYHGGFVDYGSGHLHPLKLALGLGRAFHAMGGADI